MRSGHHPLAAGRSTPGLPPLSARTSPAYFPQTASVFLRTISNRHTWEASCRAGSLLPLSLPRPLHRKLPLVISNRHLVQLETATTHAESARSLFLIVTKSHLCASTKLSSSEGLVAQACLACVRFCLESVHHAPISNRQLVQLEITVTNPKSTTSLFLIVTKQPHLSES